MSQYTWDTDGTCRHGNIAMSALPLSDGSGNWWFMVEYRALNLIIKTDGYTRASAKARAQAERRADWILESVKGFPK